MNLTDYVFKHTIRGSCTCGKCIDAPSESGQPEHGVNLTLFEVSNNGGKKEELLPLIEKEHPELLNGEEWSYIQMDVGSQEAALMLIGLGHLLGIWKALTPDTMMPFMNKEIKNRMAGAGMVKLKVVN